ncbi:hypothetical protein JCM8097_009296 [Rhodosporidiobolus ruineniae]
MMSAYSSPSPAHPPRQSTSRQPYTDDATQRFVIGKIDAGIAVLISDSVHLIEFPSLLLPPGVGPGSIVNIACTRNVAAEKQHARDFWDLQNDIFETFGAQEPSPPVLRVRNTTQTSVTLEWDKIDLASASLISLSMYRNGQRLTTIPNPLTNTSTKLSGLQLDTDYSFHLVLKTTAGTFSSPVVKTRTHTIDNTSGVRVCFGFVHPPELLDQAKDAVKAMGAKWDDVLQIDTTHFVATSSASRTNPQGGPGVEYQKAVQLSIPVVSPEWLLACQRSSKLVPISAYYLGHTNHAASLSSAELVSSPPSRREDLTASTRRGSAAAVAAAQASAPPPVVLEEPEQPQEVAPTPPPVTLEENVEEPPRDEDDADGAVEQPPAAVEPVPETKVEEVESSEATEPESSASGATETPGNASTTAIKSDVEVEAAAESSTEESPASAEEKPEEEKSEEVEPVAELEAKPDAPAEEAAVELAQKEEEEETLEPVVEAPVEAASKEVAKDDDDEPAPVDAPAEQLAAELATAGEETKEDAADEDKQEEEKKDEGETSLVDIDL